MESLLHTTTTCATYLTPKLTIFANQNSILKFSNGFSCFRLSRRKSVIVEAKKDNSKKNKKKQDSHSFVPKEDESTGFFPEAVLLKERKVQEDGTRLPEFADEEEKELFEFLNLPLQSDLNEERMRHYEVVYLIHEKHVDEVGSVNEKIQDFLTEKKGQIWRISDWGLRRLAYKIKKAKNAHYTLMNFELEARWINDFKSMLDKDERVIRHLVMKRDEAITEDCPPPPEFHTLRGGMDDDEEEDNIDYDDEEYAEDLDDEAEMGGYDDDDAVEDDTIIVNSDGEEREDRYTKSASVSNTGRKNLRVEKVGR